MESYCSKINRFSPFLQNEAAVLFSIILTISENTENNDTLDSQTANDIETFMLPEMSTCNLRTSNGYLNFCDSLYSPENMAYRSLQKQCDVLSIASEDKIQDLFSLASMQFDQGYGPLSPLEESLFDYSRKSLLRNLFGKIFSKGALPIQPLESESVRGITESEILTFSSLSASDFYLYRQLQLFEEMINKKIEKPCNFTGLVKQIDGEDGSLLKRRYFKSLSGQSLSQIVMHESLREPLMLTEYYSPSDALLLLMYWPVPHRRQELSHWNPRDFLHLKSKLIVDDSKKSHRKKKSKKKEAHEDAENSMDVSMTSHDWEFHEQEILTLTPAGQGLVKVRRYVGSQQVWTSVYLDDYVMGLRDLENSFASRPGSSAMKKNTKKKTKKNGKNMKAMKSKAKKKEGESRDHGEDHNGNGNGPRNEEEEEPEDEDEEEEDEDEEDDHEHGEEGENPDKHKENVQQSNQNNPTALHPSSNLTVDGSTHPTSPSSLSDNHNNSYGSGNGQEPNDPTHASPFPSSRKTATPRSTPPGCFVCQTPDNVRLTILGLKSGLLQKPDGLDMLSMEILFPNLFCVHVNSRGIIQFQPSQVPLVHAGNGLSSSPLSPCSNSPETLTDIRVGFRDSPRPSTADSSPSPRWQAPGMMKLMNDSTPPQPWLEVGGKEIKRLIIEHGHVVRMFPVDDQSPFLQDILTPEGNRVLRRNPAYCMPAELARVIYSSSSLGFYGDLLKEAPEDWNYIQLSANGKINYYLDEVLLKVHSLKPSDNRRVYIDAESKASIFTYRDGRKIIQHYQGSREVEYPDLTRFIVHASESVVMIMKEGYPTVEIDIDIDDNCLRHSRGEQVSLTRGGDRVRRRIALPDGSALFVRRLVVLIVVANFNLSCLWVMCRLNMTLVSLLPLMVV